MSVIKLQCREQELFILSNPLIASGGLNENILQVEFDSTWDGYTKTAIFYQNKNDIYYKELANETCIIPQEVTKKEGVMYFGFFGIKDNVRLTTEVLKYRVIKGGYDELLKPSDPTPDIYHQLVIKYDNIINGKTKVGNADKLDGHDSTYFATAEELKEANSYTDTEVAEALKSAKSYADTKKTEVLQAIENGTVTAKNAINSDTLDNLHANEIGQSGARNLIPFPYYHSGGDFYGVTYTVNDDGTVLADGIAIDSNANLYLVANKYTLKKGITYTLSGCPAGGAVLTYSLILYNKAVEKALASDTGNGVTYTPTEDLTNCRIYIRVVNGTSVSNLLFKPMLEHGYVAHPYVPYNYGNAKTLQGQTIDYFAKQEEFEVLQKKPYGMLSTENKNYYVDGINGDDNNTGTQTAPFKTFDRFLEEYFKYAELRCQFIGDCAEYQMKTIETLNSIGMHLVNASNNENITIHFKGRWTPAFYNSHLNVVGTEEKYITLDIPNALYFDGGYVGLSYAHITNGEIETNGGAIDAKNCTFTSATLSTNSGKVYAQSCVFNGTMYACVNSGHNGEVFIRSGFVNNATIYSDTRQYGALLAIGSRVHLNCALVSTVDVRGLTLQDCVLQVTDVRLKKWLVGDYILNTTTVLGTDTMGSPLDKAVDNLLPYPYSFTNYEASGLTFIDNGNGSITVNGTATSQVYYHCKVYNKIPLMLDFEKGKQYTLSGCPKGGSKSTYNMSITFRKSDDTSVSPRIYDIGNGLTFTIDEYVDAGAVKFQVVITIESGTVMDNVIFYPMIEKGNATHPYQQYKHKTAIFFGDSITWGEKADENGVQVLQPYPTVFGNLTGYTIKNVAVSGATASTIQDNNFLTQVNANVSGTKRYDYYFVAFGTNDFSKNVDIGNEYTEKSFYYDYVAGIEKILEQHPQAEIIVILQPHGKGSTTKPYWANDNGEKIESYRNAVIEIATKKKLRIVDFGNVGINENNAETYYPNGHNHLTQVGYKLLGEHLAKSFLTGTYIDKETFYNKNYRVATNQLGLKAFPNPKENISNSYYDGVYWELSGSDANGITAYKNVQVLEGENYHLEFLTYHRNQANSRTTTYTVTLTNVSDSTIQYIFKKNLKGSYERVNFNFYANNASGFYTLNIKAEGDNVYIANPSLSFDGIIPPARKRRIGNVDITSTNSITVNRNKFVNGMFMFNLFITADVSTENLARVNLNTSDTNDLNAYITNIDTYFVGIDHTTKQPVAMCWYHDTSNPGTFLLKVISGIEQDHVYCANGVLFMGANDSVHEIIVQEY